MKERTRPHQAPNLIFSQREEITAFRELHQLRQVEFWGRVGVSQSCGSRYERDRRIPRTIRMLLHIAYAPPQQSTALVEWLRNNDV